MTGSQATTLDRAVAGPARKQSTGIVDLIHGNAGLLIALAAVAAYLPPMLRSLWTDEAGMFWMARGGPIAAIQKTWHWPGQSILYSALTSFFCFEGSPFRDQFLRIPALLSVVAACYFLYRFAEDAIGAGPDASPRFFLSSARLPSGWLLRRGRTLARWRQRPHRAGHFIVVGSISRTLLARSLRSVYSPRFLLPLHVCRNTCRA